MNARTRSHGFTIVEVIVALGLSALVMIVSLAILPTFAITTKSKGRLEVVQATQQYFERRGNVWRRDADYGKILATDVPAAVTGYTWTLTACRVDTANNAYPCEYSKTFTAATMADWDANNGKTAQLVRLNLTYTPEASNQRDPVTVTTSSEFTRGGL